MGFTFKQEHAILLTMIIVTYFTIRVMVKLSEKRKKREGMESGSGSGGLSETYAAALKARVVLLQDELILSKYRKSYEEAIINLSDLIGFSMVKQAMNMNLVEKEEGEEAGLQEGLGRLNTLNEARSSLNETMKFLNSVRD